MIMYTIIQSISKNENVTVNTHSIMESSMKLYMKLKKKGKTHRGVLSQSKGDILDIEKAIPIGGDGLSIKNNGNKVKVELVNKLVKGMISM